MGLLGVNVADDATRDMYYAPTVLMCLPYRCTTTLKQVALDACEGMGKSLRPDVLEFSVIEAGSGAGECFGVCVSCGTARDVMILKER